MFHILSALIFTINNETSYCIHAGQQLSGIVGIRFGEKRAIIEHFIEHLKIAENLQT